MPKRIVVIDDCRLTLAMARDMLEVAGYEVRTAETGLEANNYIYSNPPPDLILMDVVMPMLHGDRKVRLLKEHHASRRIPVILMSSTAGVELQKKASEAGADGWIEKPLRPLPLLDLVRRYL